MTVNYYGIWTAPVKDECHTTNIRRYDCELKIQKINQSKKPALTQEIKVGEGG